MSEQQTEGERRGLPGGVISRHIGGVEYLNTTQSAKYLGYSATGFRNILTRYEEQREAEEREAEKAKEAGIEREPKFVDPLPTHVFGPPPPSDAQRDTRPRYIKRSDLDKYANPSKN